MSNQRNATNAHLLSPDVPADCDLCTAARFTHWYHEDHICWVADCEACAVPMVVWKRHGTDPSPGDIDHMIAALTAAAQTRFGIEPFSVDRDMRTIPDHWHAHARDEQWWPLRFERYMSRYTGIGTERVERT